MRHEIHAVLGITLTNMPELIKDGRIRSEDSEIKTFFECVILSCSSNARNERDTKVLIHIHFLERMVRLTSQLKEGDSDEQSTSV